jgi:hypothetical protein
MAWKEEGFQYAEHNKQLDNNYQPKCFSDRHAPESLYIKTKYT